MDLSTWEAIEQIKQLKARYFRLVDHKRWQEWGDLFTEDVRAVYSNAPHDRPHEGLPGLQCNGRTNLVEAVSRALAKGISIHHGHMPEIEITSPTTARGIWAMFDYLRLPTCIFKGYGHYEEEYVKETSGWKIKTVVLTRLHCDIQWETPANTKG
jgi:SnoaL-like domain